ncbi:MAG: GNAT family acetyltransferase [Glaciihabitans sp.]
MQIRSFVPADEDAVVRLWTECGLVRPWNDPRRDIHRKLTVQPDLFLIAEEDGGVVGSAMVGYDGHRGWVNYLAVAGEHRGRGHARALMERAEHELLMLGCPKLNLQVRAGNDAVIAFYHSLGYTEDHAVGLGKRLIPDGPAPS